MKRYNEQLLEWGETNGVNIVKTAPEFTLGTGNVDEWCFDIEDRKPCILNRMGVIKLLNVLEKQCSGFLLCKNWANIERQTSISPSTRLGHIRKGDRPQFQGTVAPVIPSNAPTERPPLLPAPTHAASVPVRTQPHSYATAAKRSSPHNVPTPIQPNAPHISHYTESHTPLNTLYTQPCPPRNTHYTEPHTPYNTYCTDPNTLHYPQPPPHITHYTQPYTSQQTHYTQPRAPQNTHYKQSRAPNSTHYTQPHAPHTPTHYALPRAPHNHNTHYGQPRAPHNTHYAQPRVLYNSPTRGSYRHGCYNCGEHNHRQDNCRFDHRLRCELCNRLGHKQRLCHLYNR